MRFVRLENVRNQVIMIEIKKPSQNIAVPLNLLLKQVLIPLVNRSVVPVI